MIYDVVIPLLGSTHSDVVIDGWLAQPGDWIEAGAPLFSVTTDKATVQVEAFRAGYLRAILAPVGASAAPGATVALLADSLEEALGNLPEGARTTTDNSLQNADRRSQAIHERPKTTETPARIGQPSTSKTQIENQKSEISVEIYLSMFRKMVLIRQFEDYLYQLFLQGLVPGTLHQYQGQEAVAVGVCSALRMDDVIFSTHRPVGHFLAKGSSPRGIAAEIWGKATGCAGGKGGQMHLCDVSVGALPSNAIVGANIPMATGAALGFKLRGWDRVAVSFFGDAASNIGAFHEGINLAAVQNAPVIFVCENNLYGASTHISTTTRVTEIAQRASAYGIPGYTVDGMDVMQVYESARRAIARARAGEGPTLLEYKTYRFAGHSRGDPGGYRTRDEVAEWRARDPIPRLREALETKYGRSEEELDGIERACRAEVEDAVDFARNSPDPDPDELFSTVYQD